MNDRYPAPIRALSRAAWITLAVTGGLLAGCEKPAQQASTARVYEADVQGQAHRCETPSVNPEAGKTTEAAVTVGNDGGWCGVSVHQPGPKPYDSFLLTARPNHGTVLIHEVGDNTRIDYTPDRGYTGTDSFSVQLIPGDGTIHETVTVTAR